MSLPITVDPNTKKVSVDESFFEELDESQAKQLGLQLEQLNSLNRHMVGLNGDVPPTPDQLTQQVTTQVNKLRESGFQAQKQGKMKEAVKHFTLAIDMVLKRPPWEATNHTIEELCNCLGPRADSYISQNLWPDAYNDAALLVLLRPMDAKNHYRKGRCLESIRKYTEAKAAYVAGLSIKPEDTDLKSSLKDVNELLSKKQGE